MIFRPRAAFLTALASAALFACAPQVALSASFSESFDGPTLLDWQSATRTESPSGVTWRLVTAIVDESETHLIDPHGGTAMGTVGFEAVASGAGTISEWLISPVIYGLNNGDKIAFYTRTIAGSPFPDRLEVRLSSVAASVDVGADSASVGVFSNLLTSVNPSLASGGYPESWTLVEATVSGLSGPTTGRFALRYYVTNGGPGGTNSNRVVVDDLAYTSNTPDSFKITSTTLQPTREMTLEFQSEPNRVYRLDYSSDLVTWAPLVDQVVSQGSISRAGDAGRLDADPVVPVGMRHDARRFYRFVDLGPTRAPAPSVAISGITADETYDDEIAVTVTSTVGGGGSIHQVTLFVDGIEVASDAPTGDTATLRINTSEFGNGPHWIHATAAAAKVLAPDLNLPNDVDQRPWAASSVPVSVNFDNFVSEWSFDPVLFQPTGTNTRTISAKLGASASWQMEIYDFYSEEVVKTFSGTGSRISVSWDGKDEEGEIVPWGFYQHRITFPGSSGGMFTALATTPKPPKPGPTKITITIGKNDYSVGAVYIEDYPDGMTPPSSSDSPKDLLPAPLEAEKFVKAMTKLGYKKKYLKENPRITEVAGQIFGGGGLMKTATFGYVIAHGQYTSGSSRLYHMPSGSMQLIANSLLLYSPDDAIYEMPLQGFQIGDTTFPGSNCKWLLVAGCSIFTDNVVTPTLSGTQAGTYPLLGEGGHGILGFATEAVIDCNLGANWVKAAHQKVLNGTTGQYEQNSILRAWWAAGLASERDGPSLTGHDIIMRAIFRGGYANEKTPVLMGDIDPESSGGQLISRSRRVAPEVATDTEINP